MSFYEFRKPGSGSDLADSGDILKLKAWFRGGMDTGITTEEGKQAIVEEAMLAFKLNEGLFGALVQGDGPDPVEFPLEPKQTKPSPFWSLDPRLSYAPASLLMIGASFIVFKALWLRSPHTVPFWLR